MFNYLLHSINMQNEICIKHILNTIQSIYCTVIELLKILHSLKIPTQARRVVYSVPEYLYYLNDAAMSEVKVRSHLLGHVLKIEMNFPDTNTKSLKINDLLCITHMQVI